MKMVCPGRVTALAVTPDGNYCVAAIAEKIHIWQVKDITIEPGFKKTGLSVSEYIRHKPACSATETSKTLEI